MPEPTQNKALFRFVFAFSGGQPVAVFDLEEDWLRPGAVTGSTNTGAALKVAVAKSNFGLDFDDDEWPESFAAAYEEFVNDPQASTEHFDWIKP